MSTSRHIGKGSSPRMRGSPDEDVDTTPPPGIIPAHAGLTLIFSMCVISGRDHPRACGAHEEPCSTIGYILGSSPRMRGSLASYLRLSVSSGIIPAHAGLTLHQRRSEAAGRDHPRACGAHTSPASWAASTTGSSPRMRGSRKRDNPYENWLGIIPAHAGLTNS